MSYLVPSEFVTKMVDAMVSKGIVGAMISTSVRQSYSNVDADYAVLFYGI